jgi:hypothetical protein
MSRYTRTPSGWHFTPLARRIALGAALSAALLTGSHIGRADLQDEYNHRPQIGTARVIEREPRLPHCEEDAVIIGRGDFTHGQWSAYECGASVDDYQNGEGK